MYLDQNIFNFRGIIFGVFNYKNAVLSKFNMENIRIPNKNPLDLIQNILILLQVNRVSVSPLIPFNLGRVKGHDTSSLGTPIKMCLFFTSKLRRGLAARRHVRCPVADSERSRTTHTPTGGHRSTHSACIFASVNGNITVSRRVGIVRHRPRQRGSLHTRACGSPASRPGWARTPCG